ncbi:MAG: hypothetical protein COB02_14820 [Candidatus Cloacimonadota bacterium]|nr:MAG: hypothetical protein COB02_14820 [Candidatus Cloacimonadota bacterium]
MSNKIVFQTEIQLAKSNAIVHQFSSYYLVQNCKNLKEPKSHVIFLKENFKKCDISNFNKPCNHKYHIVDPFGKQIEMKPSFLSYAMHINYPITPNRPISDSFHLEKISSNNHWKQYLEIRYKIEEAFSLNKKQVNHLIKTMIHRQSKLDGSWYFFKKENTIIGAIGLFTFQNKAHLVGRLQDVDILPLYQGKNYGIQLLLHTIRKSKSLGHNSLSLCCDFGEWPKKYYEKVGFKTVGLWAIY